jgi:hypothetical protein
MFCHVIGGSRRRWRCGDACLHLRRRKKPSVSSKLRNFVPEHGRHGCIQCIRLDCIQCVHLDCSCRFSERRYAGELKRKLAEEGSLDFVERRTAPLQSCYAPALFARLRQAGDWVSVLRSFSSLLQCCSCNINVQLWLVDLLVVA